MEYGQPLPPWISTCLAILALLTPTRSLISTVATAGLLRRTSPSLDVVSVETTKKKVAATTESTLGPSPGSEDSVKETVLKPTYSSSGLLMAT